LPNEIIAEIFGHFLPTYPECPPPVGLFSPSVLGCVCWKWRKITLSTPSFWSAIELRISDGRVLRSQMGLLETWLSRSGNSSLSIALTYEPTATADEDTKNLSIAPFIRLIMCHSHRWDNVELMVPFDDLHLLHGAGNIPLLRDLTFGPSSYPAGKDSVVDLFNQAPKLSIVVLTDTFLFSLIQLPWTQLTYLFAHYVSHDECAEILRHAVHLVQCTLTLCELNEVITVPSVPPHFHLQCLILLEIDYVDNSQMLLLDNLTLPALQSLQISEPWFGPSPVGTLVSLVARSGCPLEELHVTESTILESVYREALLSVRHFIFDPHISPSPSDCESCDESDRIAS
ncbi:hypothetical protein DFH09DRAFT_925366, partial [Mycena vulgaris]